MKLLEKQPAHLMYAFGGGWQVMKYVKDNVFSRTHKHAASVTTMGESWKDKARYADSSIAKYWYWCAYAGFVLAGVSQYISAMAVIGLFVAIQFVVLVLLMALSGTLIGVLAAGNFLFASYYRIFSRCPHCHEDMPIATYVCPNCATAHTRLWPSVYGVFRHRCSSCNTRLPTLDFLGRNKLTKKCAVCARPINQDIGRMTNVHIPVIGGPSTGKSNFIIMAVNGLIEQHAPKRKLTAGFSDEVDRTRYEQSMIRLNSGNALLKTSDIVPQAYTLSLMREGWRVGKVVYLYDAAGEAYSSEDNALLQTYYDYVHGIILVIDPFSIPTVHAKYSEELGGLGELRPSTLDIMASYERMLRVLEASAMLQRGKKYPHPLAVVLSKTDALGLESEIGDAAAMDLMTRDTSILLAEDAISELVEGFLISNGMDNFVRDIHLQFDNVRFFSCSALGRMPGTESGSPFKPQRALDPFLWVLGQLNVLDQRKERLEKLDELHRAGANGRSSKWRSLKYYYWDSLRKRSR